MRNRHLETWHEVAAWLLVSLLVVAVIVLFAAKVGAQAPAIYRMYDDGTDWRIERPDLPPIGAFIWFTPRDVYCGPGCYNWTYVETLLSRGGDRMIYAPDGEMVRIPFSIMPVNNISADDIHGF